MALRTEADYAVLRAVIGSKLRGLARDQYFFNGLACTDDDGALEMRFDDCAVLMSLASDGESVRAAIAELKITPPFTLDGGESCSWERVEIGQGAEFGPLIGRAVVRIEAVIDAWAEPVGIERVSGWVVRFASGDFLAYLNAGDNSKILLNQLPHHPDPAVSSRIEVVGK